jgi:hypothetical protein
MLYPFLARPNRVAEECRLERAPMLQPNDLALILIGRVSIRFWRLEAGISALEFAPVGSLRLAESLSVFGANGGAQKGIALTIPIESLARLSLVAATSPNFDSCRIYPDLA